jgi:hypothetical protein
MSQLPRIGLRPVANPVDTFAAPEVRMEAPDRTLAGLGEALQQFNPALAQFAQARGQIHNQMARETALEEMAKFQVKNKEEFAQLVREGKITKLDTPWYQRTWDEQLAKKGFEDATRVWAEEFRKDPARKSTDLTGKDYETFLRDRIKQYASGLNSVELQAIAPIAEDFVSKSVSAQVGQRTKEADRSIIAQAGRDMTKIATEMIARNDLVGPPDPNVPDNYVERAQQAADTLFQSGALPDDVASTVLAQSIYEAASRSGSVQSVNDVEALLGKLVVGTGKDAKTVKSLVPELDFKKLRDKARDEVRRELAETLQEDHLKRQQSLQNFYAEYDRTGEYDLSKLGIQEKISFLNSINSFADAAKRSNEPAVARLWQDFAQKVIDGKVSPKDRLIFQVKVAELLPPALANDYVTISNRLEGSRGWAEYTQAETYTRLMDKARKGDDMPGLAAEITQLAKEGMISKTDFDHLNGIITRDSMGSSHMGGASGVLSAGVEHLTMRINTSSIDWATRTVTDSKGNLITNPTVAASIVEARIRQRFFDRMDAYTKSPEGRDATREDSRAYAEKFINDELEISGFETAQEWGAKAPYKEVLTAVAQAKKETNAFVEDSAVQQMTFKDGQFYTRDGKLPLGNKLAVTSPEILAKQLPSVLAKLNITDDQNAGAFLADQLEALKGMGFKEAQLNKIKEEMAARRRKPDGSAAEADKKILLYEEKGILARLQDSIAPKAATSEVKPEDLEEALGRLEAYVQKDPIRWTPIITSKMKNLERSIDFARKPFPESYDIYHRTDPETGLIYTQGDPLAEQFLVSYYDGLASIEERGRKASETDEAKISNMVGGDLMSTLKRKLYRVTNAQKQRSDAAEELTNQNTKK